MNPFSLFIAWYKAPGRRLLKSAIILFVPVVILLAIGGIINRFDPNFDPDKALDKLFAGDWLVVIGVGSFIAIVCFRLIYLKIKDSFNKKSS